MLNFETVSKEYRKRILYRVSYLFDTQVIDHLRKGGEFDAQKITRMFGAACRIAQLQTDLEIGTGLDPLEEEEEDDTNSKETDPTKCNSDDLASTAHEIAAAGGNAISNFGTDNPQGPTGGDGNEVRVCDPDSGPDQVDDNGSTGSGEVNSVEQ